MAQKNRPVGAACLRERGESCPPVRVRGRELDVFQTPRTGETDSMKHCIGRVTGPGRCVCMYSDLPFPFFFTRLVSCSVFLCTLRRKKRPWCFLGLLSCRICSALTHVCAERTFCTEGRAGRRGLCHFLRWPRHRPPTAAEWSEIHGLIVS